MYPKYDWRLVSKTTPKNLGDFLFAERGIKKQEFKYEEIKIDQILYLRDAAVFLVKNAKKILVAGDYDCDGVCGAAILSSALKKCGFSVLVRIPDRDEGYGVSKKAVDFAKAKKCDTIITVDCGITDVESVAYARENGINVIVTDHHQPPKVLPPANFLVTPPKDHPLCGAAMGWALARAVFEQKFSAKEANFFARWSTDLVALATIADLVPLVGWNRTLTALGLRALAKTQRVGLKALMKVAGVKGEIRSDTVGFQIGPRINAAGRLERAMTAHDLLTTDDEAKATKLAEKINKINEKRKKITTKIVDEVEKEILGKKVPEFIVVAGDWPAGVVGLAASRVVDRFSRPCAVVSRKNDKIGVGSVRSVDGFDLIAGLRDLGDDFFEKVGGHAMAAGFSVKLEKIDELREKMCGKARDFGIGDGFSLPMVVDCPLSLAEVTEETVDICLSLEPLGQHCPEPVFMIFGKIKFLKSIGEGKHHSFVLSGSGIYVNCIFFGSGDFSAYFADGDEVFVAGSLMADVWNGERRVKMRVMDIKK